MENLPNWIAKLASSQAFRQPKGSLKRAFWGFLCSISWIALRSKATNSERHSINDSNKFHQEFLVNYFDRWVHRCAGRQIHISFCRISNVSSSDSAGHSVLLILINVSFRISGKLERIAQNGIHETANCLWPGPGPQNWGQLFENLMHQIDVSRRAMEEISWFTRKTFQLRTKQVQTSPKIHLTTEKCQSFWMEQLIQFHSALCGRRTLAMAHCARKHVNFLSMPFNTHRKR